MPIRLQALKARSCGLDDVAAPITEANAVDESNGNTVRGRGGTKAAASVMPPAIMAAPSCEYDGSGSNAA